MTKPSTAVPAAHPTLPNVPIKVRPGGSTARGVRINPSALGARALAKAVTSLMVPMARYEFFGTQNLPHDVGFIAAANHVSDFDALTFADFLFANGFPPHVLAKKDLFKIPVVGSLMRGTGMIPVDRGTVSAASSLDAAAQVLAKGECVAIFPEGTLTRDPDYWPMVGKTGVARLALATKAPVIPVGQWGAINVWGRYSKVIKPFPPKLIKIAAGPPVDLNDFYDQPVTPELLKAATSRIMDAITVLVAEVRGVPAPAHRFDLAANPEYKKKRAKYPPPAKR